MLLREDEICDDLPIKIAFEVVADHFFLSVSGVHEHIFTIARINIIDFVPAEGLECAVWCRLDLLFELNFDILLQLADC